MPGRTNRRDALKLVLVGRVATNLQAVFAHGLLMRVISRRCVDSKPLCRSHPCLSRDVRTSMGTTMRSGREPSALILPAKQSTIRGYNGIFPGPTIEAKRGRPARVGSNFAAYAGKLFLVSTTGRLLFLSVFMKRTGGGRSSAIGYPWLCQA
jgi:hypothetical protein